MTAVPTQNTLMLSLDSWDLVLDASGNLVIATPPYSTAQDVASAIRTFLGEVFFDLSLGVPYTQQLLGQVPPLSVLQAGIEAAALTVPGVINAVATVDTLENRQVTGRCDFTTTDGDSGTVGL